MNLRIFVCFGPPCRGSCGGSNSRKPCRTCCESRFMHLCGTRDDSVAPAETGPVAPAEGKPTTLEPLRGKSCRHSQSRSGLPQESRLRCAATNCSGLRRWILWCGELRGSLARSGRVRMSESATEPQRRRRVPMVYTRRR